MADPLPPLNGLRAFEVTGRVLSFRAAAEVLGVTPSAVAQQVRALEAHLGLALFRRVPAGVELTELGQRFHAQISRGFRQLEAAMAEVQPVTEAVTVSVTPTFAAKWLIPRLQDFTRAHPAIDLRITASERMASFQRDGVDLAVRLAAPPFPAALEAFLLARQEVVAVCVPGLVPEVQGGVPVAAALRGLVYLHDSHDLWPRFLQRYLGAGHGVVPRGPVFSQTALCIDAAVAGQGVALVPRLFVAGDLAAGRLVQPFDLVIRADKDFWVVAPRPGARHGQRAAVAAVWSWFRAGAEAVV